ncbi:MULTISPECIES: hypothetical protein [unclassified Streptomyces]|uniref:hypothetical protein n=1 Tax=unclassified Streptomyces TaxID=2593676 RepID=UPI00344EAF43
MDTTSTDDVMHRLGKALQAYGAAKHAAGRIDLFHQLSGGHRKDDIGFRHP